MEEYFIKPYQTIHGETFYKLMLLNDFGKEIELGRLDIIQLNDLRESINKNENKKDKLKWIKKKTFSEKSTEQRLDNFDKSTNEIDIISNKEDYDFMKQSLDELRGRERGGYND